MDVHSQMGMASEVANLIDLSLKVVAEWPAWGRQRSEADVSSSIRPGCQFRAKLDKNASEKKSHSSMVTGELFFCVFFWHSTPRTRPRTPKISQVKKTLQNMIFEHLFHALRVRVPPG